MQQWFGEFLKISSNEPTKCLKKIRECIDELASLREYYGDAVDGTTEIIIKPQSGGIVTVGMKWKREIEDGDNQKECAAGGAFQGRGRDGSMLGGREETDTDAGID